MKKHIKKGRILFMLGLAAVVVTESVARLVLGLGTPPLSVPDPEIEYMFKPDQEVMRFGNRQRYNAYGMRNEDFPVGKPDGEYRVLCFGDSVLNGGNLTDHTELATVRLQEQLQEQWSNPVLVANISAGSWGPVNMLAYARRYGLFGADQVVVQLSSHDIGDVPDFAPLNRFTHPVRNPCCATWEGITRYLPRYIPALKPLLQREDSVTVPSAHSPEELEQLAKNAHDRSLEALSGLLKLSKEQSAGFLILLHSERAEAESGEMGLGHDRFVEWANENRVGVMDLGPAEMKSLKAGVDPYRPGDGIHPSVVGQQIIADHLFIYLTRTAEKTQRKGE